MLHIILLILIISPIDSVYQSTLQFTSIGLQYQPNNNLQLISTKSIKTKLLCSAQCNQLTTCRIFDYDTVSKRCRLFEGDLTTGSIISSSSSTSVVGTVQISSNLYSSVYNQSCQLCHQNRYETCCTNTSTCQCPGHTYWNGSVCALQLFVNATCGQSNACRSDLNLSCLSDCYGYSSKCLPSATYSKKKIYSHI